LGEKENEMGRIARQDAWLSRQAAADYLVQIGVPISFRSLEKMAMHNNSGQGPPFFRFGWKTVRYRQSDLDVWAKKRTVRVE
jgi:hypothetical protein